MKPCKARLRAAAGEYCIENWNIRICPNCGEPWTLIRGILRPSCLCPGLDEVFIPIFKDRHGGYFLEYGMTSATPNGAARLGLEYVENDGTAAFVGVMPFRRCQFREYKLEE